MIWGLSGRGWIFTISCCCSILVAIAQITHPSEVASLQAVKKSLVDGKNYLGYWNKGDPCISNWTGVLCFYKPGTDGYLHVRELQLMNMNLSGSLAPELGQLFHLMIINFMWNCITGTIPKEIGNIASLKLLLLNGNELSGSLPDELGNLSNLNRLQVDQNSLSGPIPKSFANLSNIKHLHMNNNSFSGQIPPQLSQLSTLLHILLDNNNFSGYLPAEFSYLPDLRIIQLDNNNFDGAEIPTSYGNMSKLAKLSLRNCSLQGAVPDLSNVLTLIYLDLSWNHLSGAIPSNPLSDTMTTIDLSNNNLNGSIPGSFADLPLLQRLSLQNNLLSGSLPVIWQNMTFDTTSELILDLQNNSISNILGDLNPPENVTLRLQGNPICNNANLTNTTQFCGPDSGADVLPENTTNATMICQEACPMDSFFEPIPDISTCFCGAPIRIGYRLKSPSFSYFAPHKYPFEKYLTTSLNLTVYQLYIDSVEWENGPRLRMYLKLFPSIGASHMFNTSEVRRIRHRFMSWEFRGSDLFGPYELLNFTLLGPYANNAYVIRRTGISKGVLVAVILGIVAFIIAISALITLVIVRRQVRNQRGSSRKHLSTRISMRIEGVKGFTFKEMILATDAFNISTQVGRGGYGRVYKGILSGNATVAIKRAEEGSLQGQKEFLTEIELLSRLHHRNLVSLLGYCDEEGEQMLVYEFMPNGTLRDWLSGKTKESLNFGARLRIALGAAKGILYLHTEASPPIFHRDIKATNILLDSKLTAKVADFGLSRLAPELSDEGTVPDHVSTMVKGTPGYLDPEYFLTRKLTDKSDVYSLGVVFLEILTGMQPISHGKNIVREVNMANQLGMMFSVIDSKMGSYPSECVERFVALALRCCQDKPEDRLSMLNVVRELENILQMLPETESTQSESSSTYSGNTPRSVHYVSRNSFFSSNVSGSDLNSNVTPNILPR